MDAGAADPLRAARPEEGEDKPKPAETADDGYETSNSGEARRKPSPEPSPAPPPDPPSPPAEPPYEHLMRYPEPEPEPDYRHFEPPHHQENPYQHFPFPKYNEPYGFKRESELPYDMSQHHHPYGPMGGKRDEDVYNGIKRECEDPYSFVEDEHMLGMMQPPHQLQPMLPHQHPHMMHQIQCMNQPKKRGRKKKIKDENGMEIKLEAGMEGALVPRPVKERKKHDRFNGMSEEEVSRRTLPDHLAENLDIIIIGINPGLFAAYKGHHYAGPGNHFWKCLYLSGLTREQMSADEDYKLLNFGIGFTNMVPRATKGSADLTRREIKEGSAALLDKLRAFRPKVAVFNGKLIYEVFSGKKDFCFGKQPDTIAGTNTYMWVMPSSSARCAQLPRAADKVPFYAALKKFRDFLNGLLPHLDDAELVFPDTTGRRPQEEMEIRRLTMEPEPGDTIILEDGTEVPLKKKRGRPKKVKLENGEVAPPAPRAPRAPRPPPSLDPNGEQPPKKKRGRPKKIRPEEQQFLLQQQQQQQQQATQQPSMLSQQLPPMQSIQHEQQQQQQQQQQYLPGEFPPQHQHQLMYHHQINDNATYYQNNNEQIPLGMESPLEVSSLARGYASPARGYTPPARGYTPPAPPYAASPRAVYASPRSQPYSPGPARTPQPQQQAVGGQFPGSPAAFPASPPRPYSSPAARPAFPARSPLYSPAPYHTQQESLFREQGGATHSPAPYTPSPHYSPQHQSQSQSGYPRSPAPVAGAGAGAGAGAATPTASFPAASPQTFAASPRTPYSHHSSPAPPYHDTSLYRQGQGSVSTSSGGSGLCAELSQDIGAAISASPAPSPPPHADFEPPPAPPASPPPAPAQSGSLSPGGATFARALYDSQEYAHEHYTHEQGSGIPESPRLDLQQHNAMFSGNFNRATPEGACGGGAFSPAPAFRAPHTPHPSPHAHYDAGSPGEYNAPKPKSQDVASKSLSGLESLVDQIPSIAEGVGGGAGAAGGGAEPGAAPAAPPLPEYAPTALYPPYGPYGGTPYTNNGYGGGFVGYGGGWAGGLMRPAPGYLAEWQYGYGGVAPAYPSPYNAPYYNSYSHPPPAHHQQTHYLSAGPLLELHKSGEHSGGVPAVPSVPSVGFGGFC